MICNRARQWALPFVLSLISFAGPAHAQATTEVPGEPVEWFSQKVEEAASLAPALADLQEEALLRARFSVTTRVCDNPPKTMRLYGLQPAVADRTVANGILEEAFVGAWTFYAETDCPQTPLLRYMYVLEADGDHIMLIVNRGQSIATPTMMQETSELAATEAFDTARARQPGCDVSSVGMRATRIEATDNALGPDIGGARFTGGWSEIWNFRACQQDVEVRIRFDTDGKGGTNARILDTRITS